MKAPESYSLKHTLESGQFFRYEEAGGKYIIISHGRIFVLQQKGKAIDSENADEAFVKNFLGINNDCFAAIQQLKKDSTIAPMVAQFGGISIMRQDPWECTAAFICSQNSNIKRITKNLNGIAACFGRKIKYKDCEGFAFPPPKEIKNNKELRSCRLGYRHDYLLAAAKQFKKFSGSYEEAREQLMKIKGIGEKVADCICLFSLGHTQAFPVDVWILKAMKHFFSIEKPKEIKEFAKKRWEKNAGYAQQYLYHWARHNL